MTKVIEAKLRTSKEIEAVLHPIVKEWFFSKFDNFSLPQLYGVMNVWERKNTLISAPTGGTKTLTAFLSILNYLVTLAEKQQLENKIYAVYVSPLKALSNDIHKNLVEPLREINELAEKKKVKLQEIRVGLRTGDTEAKDRVKMVRKVPHILITTPETLAIVLTAPKFVDNLKALEFCVIDEVHSLDNKRGVHLSLSLERLNELSIIWPVKIGLSATIAPLDEVAKFLVGESIERHVEVAEVKMEKKIDIKVLTPVADLINDSGIQKGMYDLMDKMIREHKTTLVFTNTRSATERVVNHLKEYFPTEYGEDTIAAHHSSLGKDMRFNIEQRLREGKLKVVVCSTSLELGIDIGYIDLIIMLGSPKSSARALQRLGRSGHRLHDTPKGRFIIMDRDDLVESCVIQKEMIEGKINKVVFPKNCLDVLSQQIFGMAIYKKWSLDDVYELVKKSYCYKTLNKEDFMSVISYLAGEYGLEDSYVYAKIWYDKNTKEIGRKGKLARVIYMTNIGTIPEESFVNVKLTPSGEHIGVIDEGFLEKMKKGDIFVLGGNKYIYMYTKGMNLYVRATVSRPPTIPSWFSEMLPLSFDSALEIQRFRKLIEDKMKAKKSRYEIIKFISDWLYCNEHTAEAIYNYFKEQYDFLEIPNENLLLVERYKAEKNYVIVHSMYGRRVNDALSRAIAYCMAQLGGRDVEIGINDNGFYFAGERLPIEKAIAFLEPENLQKVLREAVEKTDILARRFRHCAKRALMILKNYKGMQKTVGKQQLKSHFLLAAIRKISTEFPILKEARREVLEDLMDINNTKIVLQWIKEGKVKVKYEQTSLPSPFALNLILQGHSDLIRIEDKQAFLKRMHEAHLRAIGKIEKL